MNLKYANNSYDVDFNLIAGQVSANFNLISARINGNNFLFKMGSSLSNMFTLTVPNTSGEEVFYKFFTAEDDNHIYVNCDGDCLIFDKIKDEEKSFDANGTDTGNKQVVLPPMPGTIVKVMVEKDQTVSEGDALIIVEAMKMETTLYAAINGKVTEVNAQAAEQVDADKVLIVIEKAE